MWLSLRSDLTHDLTIDLMTGAQYGEGSDGECVDNRCVCSDGWSGDRCHRKLVCMVWIEEAGWSTTDGCIIDLQLNRKAAPDHFVCACRVTMHHDVAVAERALMPLQAPPLFAFNALSWEDLIDYLLETNIRDYWQVRPRATALTSSACVIV